MNKIIRNIDLERILFFDIETVSQNRELNVNSEEYRDYSLLLRDRTTGFMPPTKEIKTHYENNAALYAEYNKVVTVSVGFIKDQVLYYKAIVGTQKEIIEEFYKIVSETGFEVCGHNIKGFDLPTLRIKAWQEDINLSLIPNKINECDVKPWLLKVLDTMELIKGTGYKNMSLNSACRLIGIPSSKDDISGSEVTKTYYAEGVERIAKYCNKDVIATAHLFCSLAGKRDYIIKEVERETKEKQTVNLLEHVRISGELTPNISNKIVEWAEETNQDKANVLHLVIVALSYTRLNNVVDKEDYQDLKEKLGLQIDYSDVQCLIDKGNLGGPQADELIEKYKTEVKEKREEIVNLTEKFLVENEKHQQDGAIKHLKYLKEMLISQKYLKIQEVIKKGSLAKTQANSLIKKYKKKSLEERQEVFNLVEQYLNENSVELDTVAVNSLDHLRVNLLEETLKK